jgi:hypothetical protein
VLADSVVWTTVGDDADAGTVDCLADPEPELPAPPEETDVYSAHWFRPPLSWTDISRTR